MNYTKYIFNFKKNNILKRMYTNNFENLYNILFSSYINGLLRLIFCCDIDDLKQVRYFKFNKKLVDGKYFINKKSFINNLLLSIKCNTDFFFLYNKYLFCWIENEKYNIEYSIKKYPILLNFAILNANILTYNIINNLYHVNGLFLHLIQYIYVIKNKKYLIFDENIKNIEKYIKIKNDMDLIKLKLKKKDKINIKNLSHLFNLSYYESYSLLKDYNFKFYLTFDNFIKKNNLDSKMNYILSVLQINKIEAFKLLKKNKFNELLVINNYFKKKEE